MKRKILWLLLLITFLKGLLWAGVTPIFQGPDEPFHYSIVQYVVEEKNYPFEKNTASLELEKGLRLLEFNKVIFNPEKTQSFSKGIYGKNEKKINQISQKNRQTLSKNLKFFNQNPPFYYLISAPFYFFSPVKDLIWRIYFLRLFSVLCFTLTIFLSFKTTSLIFGKETIFSFIPPFVISFLPMVSFITATINNENLYILFLTLIIYFLIKDLKIGLKIKEIIFLGFLCGLSFLTRQSFFSFFIAILSILTTNGILKNQKKFFLKIVIFAFIFILTSFWYFKQPIFRDLFLKIPYNFIANRSFYEDIRKYRKVEIKSISFIFYLQRFFQHRQPKKLFNYFWGTFGWVDTRLPRVVYQAILGFFLLSFWGFLRYLRKATKEWRQNLWLWQMIGIVFFFGFSLIYYEWRHYQVYEDFFLQGRYFFPLILPIIIFLTIGWQSLFPKNWQNQGLFVLTLLTIIFNFYSLFFIMIKRYYSARDPVSLVIQLSQYKPEFLKGIAWSVIVGLYIILVIKLIRELYSETGLKKSQIPNSKYQINFKHQIPNKLQIKNPNYKLQVPNKLQ